LVRPKQWKGDKRFGARNVKKLYRSGSLTTVARELAKYKLDLMGVREGVGQGYCMYMLLWKRTQ
jgi:hypothetical protein